MSRHDDNVRLKDMLDHSRTALTFVQGQTEAEFRDDRMCALACIRLLEIVGEAASRVSAEIRDTHPEIRWPAIVGLRNRLIHAYSDVDLGIVWKIIVEDLPPLIGELEKLADEDTA